MTVILGYTRVSTVGQYLDAQRAALHSAGVDAERLFTDQLFGSAKKDRPSLAALLDYARPGDSVVVTAIDRLGRSSLKSPAPSPSLGSAELYCAP